MIVGLGALSITLAVIVSTLALIHMLSKRKLDVALNEQDVVEIELGIKCAEKEPGYFKTSFSRTCILFMPITIMLLLQLFILLK